MRTSKDVYCYTKNVFVAPNNEQFLCIIYIIRLYQVTKNVSLTNVVMERPWMTLINAICESAPCYTEVYFHKPVAVYR